LGEEPWPYSVDLSRFHAVSAEWTLSAMGKSNSNYNDLYIPDDGRGVGHLKIRGNDTQLKRLSSAPIGDMDKPYLDQHGFLKTGAKASLLGCLFLGSTQYLRESGKHEARFFPHCVLTASPSSLPMRPQSRPFITTSRTWIAWSMHMGRLERSIRRGKNS